MKDSFLENSYNKLKEYMEGLIKFNERQADGFKIFAPSDGLYNAIWPDDYTFPIIACEDAMSKEDYQKLFDFLTKSCIDLPWVPDRVEFNGMPVMQPGICVKGQAHGTKIPAHLPSAWVRILSYLVKYGVKFHHKKEWFQLIKRSYALVAYSCGLVYIDPQAPSVAFAYNDCAGISGFEFMASIVNMQGFKRGLELFKGVIDPETKALWQRRVTDTMDNLYRLFNKEQGGYMAGSAMCKQVHVWGNGLIYSKLDKEKQEIVGKTLVDSLNKTTYLGFTRQMIEDEGWEDMLVNLEKGIYMNGGYWATGTGYILEAVYKTDKEAGMKLINEMIENLPKYDYPEWINTERNRFGAVHFHMAVAIPLVSIKAMLEDKSLIDMF